MDINALEPYVNYIDLKDGCYRLEWCNDSMARAVEYWRVVFEEEISFVELVKRAHTYNGLAALIYGASGVQLEAFPSVFDVDRLGEYSETVLEGLEHYFPELKDEDKTDEALDALDETYPILKKKKRKPKD